MGTGTDNGEAAFLTPEAAELIGCLEKVGFPPWSGLPCGLFGADVKERKRYAVYVVQSMLFPAVPVQFWCPVSTVAATGYQSSL